MDKAFTRINWENTPSIATPLNEDNLNEGDAALDIIDDRVISLDLTKANQSDLLQTVKTITYNTTTGVFVFTWWNGTSLNVDLNIEKIPVTFSMDANGVITMTTADGTTYTADVGSLIKQYSFVDSSEIDFTVTVDAQTGDKSVTASIKDGSITGQKLQPNYLADITTQATNASNSATSASGSATNAHADAQLAQSYAVGTGGTVRTGDATDNAKYYKEQAEQAAADASAAAHVSTMTLSTNGIGRPDGTTITVDANGVFTATNQQVYIYPDPNVLPSAATAKEAIYLIDDPTASGEDICKEWVVVTTNGVKTWKCIGSTSVDLSGYATTTQLNTKVNKTDLARIEATGSTNATGSTIKKDTYFWLNGNFVQALTDIAVNATFTANSNYKVANDVLNKTAAKVNEFIGTRAEFEQAILHHEIEEGASIWLLSEYPVHYPVYGVTWDGSSSQSWTRTDDAVEFSNPSPAINNGTGSSPFDNIYPWSAMEKVTDADVGELVKIPKFYYKLTQDGSSLSLQITEVPRIGFSICPACADRGDGEGERDYVYVSRYHCATSTYKSTTSVKPQTAVTRADFRTNIHSLGTDIWQYDISTHITIWMLYLVEFANWDSQKTIGYGGSVGGSATENMGATDAMQYHTGTSAASRTDYGHVQYRNIEDLWGNVYDFCDGIYFSDTNIYAIKNPSSFSDTTGGTLVGTRAAVSGHIKSMKVSSVSGFEWFMYPDDCTGATEDTYVGDYCIYGASAVVLYVGGNTAKFRYLGLFFLCGNYGALSAGADVGSRLIKLP